MPNIQSLAIGQTLYLVLYLSNFCNSHIRMLIFQCRNGDALSLTIEITTKTIQPVNKMPQSSTELEHFKLTLSELELGS